MTSQRIYKLKGVVQPYAWGGSEFIPQLTGMTAGEGKPAAEYWLGAHPLAPSIVDIKGQPTLPDLISENKQVFLGKNLSPDTDSLPFLVKVLDVCQMLSIQVHPDKQGAEEGFKRENAAGIPLSAASRSYKDRNRKMEVMFALSDFWLLRGFRPAEKMSEFFSIPEFSFLETYYREGGYKLLYSTIMKMEQAKVNEVLTPLAERVTLRYNENRVTKGEPDYWAARALKTYFVNGDIDRGIFSIYLLNLLYLSKGKCVDQKPGVLHAYLEGQNVEIMSNSDNVLRAGLTNKHVDVEELLAHIRYDGQPVEVPRITQNYRSSDFEVFHYTSPMSKQMRLHGPTIVLVISGAVIIQGGSEMVKVNQGESVYMLPDTGLDISSSTDVEFFVVSVPKKEV